jgi:peptidoglycan/xylan/chitin deacetylase (PgdA/CDA1 family)
MPRTETRPEARAKTRALAGTVALSFDDGPDPTWTPRVLAELGRRGALATFFVEADRASAEPELVEAMLAAGHEVGLHCVRHVRHTELSEAEVFAEAERGLEALAALGTRPRAWRAPWGIVTAATVSAAAAHDLELWNWSFDSHDWRGDTREEMLAALDSEGGLDDGSVVLMHDGLGPGATRRGCRETVRLTADLLAIAATAGLRPAPLSIPVAVTG